MTCPGLHCPGCTEGQSLAITGGAVVGLVLAAETVQWVADRVLWIGGTMAACLALSVAVSMSLEAWADRRGARFAAAHGILSRADVILPEPVAAPRVTATVLPPAIEHHHYGPQSHVYPGGEEAAARIMRHALGRMAGDAITGTDQRDPSS